MDFEIENFCADRAKTVSAAALSKARDKINFDAFKELLVKTAKEIPVQHTYKGYRLIAYDGMKGELPRTPELLKASHTIEKNRYPEFHAIAEYDVLNCNYTNAVFYLGTCDERKGAVELLKEHEYEGNEIFLLDRGFPSLKLIQELDSSGKNYVMRVSKSFLKEVNDFGKNKAKDKEIQVFYDKERARVGKVKDVELPYHFKFRCVKIELRSGQTELLITNLAKANFPRKDIGELYNLRWKIETGFMNLKYAVHVEDFMGIKENSIKQEFFGSLIKSNIVMQFMNVADMIIHNKKNSLRLQKQHAQSGSSGAFKLNLSIT